MNNKGFSVSQQPKVWFAFQRNELKNVCQNSFLHAKQYEISKFEHFCAHFKSSELIFAQIRANSGEI